MSKKETTDLSFAAYCCLEGLQIHKASEWRRGSVLEFRFTLDDPENKFDSLKVQFANSKCSRYDGHIRTLKRLCKLNNKA